MWVQLFFAGLLAGAADAGQAPAANGPAIARATASAPASRRIATIDGLLAQLGSPRFAVREQATQELTALDAELLPELVDRYRAESRYEPKRRIRYVIEYIFHRDQIVGRNGFLGIEVWPQVLPDTTDPVSGKTTRGVVIKTVKPGFAAERGGLQNGDIIIGFNDEVLPEDPTTSTFIQKVSGNAPGTMLRLRVLRSGDSQTIRVKAASDPRKTLEGAKFVHVALEASAQAVWVASVAPGSRAAAAGLKPGTLIRSVDGNRLQLAAGQFEVLLGGATPGREVPIEVTSMQVISAEVKLGSRPPEYISDPKDKLEAQARFLKWWQEQGGELSSHGSGRATFHPLGVPQRRPDSAVIP